MKTRLQLLCEAFGWQGGTIHQANEKAAKVVGMTHFDAMSYTEIDFQDHLECINNSMIPSDWFKE